MIRNRVAPVVFVQSPFVCSTVEEFYQRGMREKAALDKEGRSRSDEATDDAELLLQFARIHASIPNFDLHHAIKP